MEQLTPRPAPRPAPCRTPGHTGRARRRALASLGLFVPFILSVAMAPTAAAAPPPPPPGDGPATYDKCVRLGPDSRVKVTGTFRVQNTGCRSGGWRTVSGPTWLDLTDGEYVESRGPGSSCTNQSGRPGTPKPGGSSFCGPAWETRNDPVPGW